MRSQHEKPFSEKDLSDDELNAVRHAIKNARKDGRDYIRYGDYGTKEPWHKDADSIIGEIDMLFDDPARSAMYTLGMAKFDENGTVYDTYDFGAAPDVKIRENLPEALHSVLAGNNPRAVFNLIGNAVGLRSGKGRKVEIKTQ
jgi:hypothetical protein